MKITFFYLLIFNSYFVQTIFGQNEYRFNHIYFDSSLEKTLVVGHEIGLPLFICSDSLLDSASIYKIDKKFNLFCSKIIHAHDTLSEQRKVHKIFNSVENTYLYEYDSSATVSDIFKNGRYNCVGAVTLVSLALSYYNIHHEIVETAHHVYIKVILPTKEIMLETTDGQNGFILSKKLIKSKEDLYSSEKSDLYIKLVKIAGGEKCIEENHHIHKIINCIQLCGLQYFNKSISMFYIGKYSQSLENLEKAFLLYPTNRINGMMLICMNKMLKNAIALGEKNTIIRDKIIHQRAYGLLLAGCD